MSRTGRRRSGRDRCLCGAPLQARHLNLTYLGRGPTVAQKHALLFRDPLCTAERCGLPIDEFDHRIDYADTKHTRVTELDGFCGHHHDRKTYDGWALVPGTGRRPMVPRGDRNWYGLFSTPQPVRVNRVRRACSGCGRRGSRRRDCRTTRTALPVSDGNDRRPIRK